MAWSTKQNRSNYNVKVKHRFRRQSSVDGFDTGKMQQGMEPSHIAYDNMLGAGLMMQKFEDDMKRNLKDQMNKAQHALSLKESKGRKGRVWYGLVIHTMSILFTKHKVDTTFGFLGPCCTKFIYGKTNLNYQNTVCKTVGLGPLCKIYITSAGQGSTCKSDPIKHGRG